MLKRRPISVLLVLSILFGLLSVCFTASSRTVNKQGISYNESALHTLEAESVNDIKDPSDTSANITSVEICDDSDADHGKVIELVGGDNSRITFEDMDVIKNRKYYVYFDAKSETDNAQLVSMIGRYTNSEACRYFFSGLHNHDTGVQFYIDGEIVTASEFELSTEWQRYGVVFDTSNEEMLSAIESQISYAGSLDNEVHFTFDYDKFWEKEIHFMFGVQNATVYFDNIQLIEIDPRPAAVPALEDVAAAVSVRLPKTANENNGEYLSAGLRFMGVISDDLKENADEIGFIITPSVYAIENTSWYDLSSGVQSNVRSKACYIKDEMDVAYSVGFDSTAYQLILVGLSTAAGKTSYIQRYCAAMYVKTGDSYQYFALGETSYNEVCAKYYVMNIKSGHINSGIELSLNGVSQKTNLTVGDTLPVLNTILSDAPARYDFLGWYDETLSTKYTTVPNGIDKLYGLYDGYSAYTFDTGSFFNPNNKNYISAVNDPFGGDGMVLYSPIEGNFRGFVPTICDGINTDGFSFKKDHTYRISFDYRFAETDSASATFGVEIWGVSKEGIYVTDNKTKIIYPDYIPPTGSSGTATNKGDWATYSFTVTNVTDHPYIYIRFTRKDNDVIDNVYVDNLVISDISTYLNDTSTVKLINGGIVENTDLSVGDTLPVLEDYDETVNGDVYSFAFDGWYDETLTTKYTTVVDGVDVYYAKYDSMTSLSFEIGGLYDPNNRYQNQSGSIIPAWYRAVDPTGADNICIRGRLGGNSQTTHFAPSLVEGADVGIQMEADKKYLITYDYFISSDDPIVTQQGVSVRGAAQTNIGYSNNKTGSLTSQTMTNVNCWSSSAMLVVTSSQNTEGMLTDCPYLIILSQNTHYLDTTETTRVSNLDLYLDNIRIMEFPIDSDVVVYTEAKNVTLNQNGEVEIYNDFNVGDDIPDPATIDGVNFVGWYNETLNRPYKTIPGRNTTLYAKYDAAINTFENRAIIDPNNNFANNNRVKIATDPTDPENSVMMVNLNNSTGNLHFVLSESSYGSDPKPYKLTIGSTYTITYKYYIENVNSSGVAVQFRGCKEANVGISGGKSVSYGNTTVKTEGAWTTVTTTFTYKGTDITDEPDAYLIMMAQDGMHSSDASACTATIYFDDVIIKETAADKTYTQKTTTIGGYTLGYANGREHNIVVPTNNFSYLAMMQVEKLQETIKGITTTSCEFNIIKESEWDSTNTNQSNIFIGDVTGHSRDNQYKIDTSSFTTDDYAYCFGNGNIYIDGGSTQSLAMAISELTKQLEAAANNTTFAAGTIVSGKYSEKIGSYSTKDYYRGTFLEDFDGEDVDTTVWNEINGSTITAAKEGWKSTRSNDHTYLEDGKLVIEADFNEDEKMFYGGMLRTHGKMEYRYGYLEVSCITPHGTGLWSATWTSHDTTHQLGTGFYSSEVDINESFGNAQYTAFNMHSWPTSAANNMGYYKYSLDQVSGQSKKKADAGVEAGFNLNYHTFGYLWTENSAKFIVDGFVQLEYNYDDLHTSSKFNGSITNNDYDAFNETLSVIVSMTVANGGTSNQEPSDEDLLADYWNTSNKYIVDYVHIYQIDGQDIFYH